MDGVLQFCHPQFWAGKLTKKSITKSTKGTAEMQVNRAPNNSSIAFKMFSLLVIRKIKLSTNIKSYYNMQIKSLLYLQKCV